MFFFSFQESIVKIYIGKEVSVYELSLLTDYLNLAINLLLLLFPPQHPQNLPANPRPTTL